MNQISILQSKYSASHLSLLKLSSVRQGISMWREIFYVGQVFCECLWLTRILLKPGLKKLNPTVCCHLNLKDGGKLLTLRRSLHWPVKMPIILPLKIHSIQPAEAVSEQRQRRDKYMDACSDLGNSDVRACRTKENIISTLWRVPTLSFSVNQFKVKHLSDRSNNIHHDLIKDANVIEV